ncbi:acyl carrier protein [Paenibacillus sp. HB172176]|uniref:acyl carrier protein n=1 Tax=Paenibacillus sp. HB172176 TaxID=2493690 RepID=UPI00143B285A|nr:acyl carrier protein [Paenibacillus sp. HB172176]
MLTEQDQSPLERTVIELLANLLKRPPEEIEPDHSLLNDLYLDSLHVLELLTLLEQRFGFETDAEDLQPHVFRTVNSVIAFVRERAQL